ncbi:MAG: hypothetical protein U5R14_06150 [Gemmatimonadota bacterium]|nr:hypothetical protein [Gemmatimonadota bacterium]
MNDLIRGVRIASAAVVVGASVLALGPASATAQMGGQGFVFQHPKVSVAFHGGYAVPSANSDLFDQTTTDLRLGRDDFHAPYVGGELAVWVSERWDVALDVGHAWSTTRAEWDAYLEDGRPIWQVVELARTPVTVSGKYYLTDRGRTIGRFVWIPARVTPFLGGGLGFMRYRFAQDGDFVVEETLEIFTDRIEQVGTAFTAHGFAGADVHLAKALYLSTKVRYMWARDGLDRSLYNEFEPVDLSGVQVTLGLGVRF